MFGFNSNGVKKKQLYSFQVFKIALRQFHILVGAHQDK